MPLLCKLGVVEGLAQRFKIAAAILPIGVEEQRIEALVQIIVMRDIALRLGLRIALLPAALEIAQEIKRAAPALRLGVVLAKDMEHVGDGAFFDDQRAVHIGFAEFQFGIEQHLTQCRAGVEAYCDRLAGAVAEGENLTVRNRHPEIATTDISSRNSLKQPMHLAASTPVTPSERSTHLHRGRANSLLDKY